ncbi:MAG: ParB/RepB/Spo0J family partition protein [Pyrinomonadaceae bacterium]|nr:ParB/RepB/Spo0J family partition protein [Pyrinomonadaceae bacterium]
MARKALGRGLSALIGDETSSGDETLTDIDIDLIEPNSEQPRTIFEDDRLEELAQSIRANGIVQPIVVRRQGSHFQLVAGERRWRAAQRAGLTKIPSIIKDVADDKLLEIALIENIQRQELNAIEEARAYKKLIDTVGLTQESVAERVGKNRTTITTFLRLLKLPDDILKLIEKDKISAGHGRALLMAGSADIQRNIAKQVLERSLSVRETERTVKRSGTGAAPKDKAPKIKLDANQRSAETKLRRRLATQVHILPDGKGTGGKIEIEYYSEGDLDRIYQLLMEKS